MYIDEKLFYKVFTLFLKLKTEYYSVLFPVTISSLLQLVCTKAMQGFFFLLIYYFFFYFFFLSGFSFTNIHESQDCRGRGRAFL